MTSIFLIADSIECTILSRTLKTVCSMALRGFQPHTLLLPTGILLLSHLPLLFGYSLLSNSNALLSSCSSSTRKALLILRIQHKCQQISLGTDLVPGEKQAVHLLWFNIIFFKLLECHLFSYCKCLCVFSLTLIWDLLKSRFYVLFMFVLQLWTGHCSEYGHAYRINNRMAPSYYRSVSFLWPA